MTSRNVSMSRGGILYLYGNTKGYEVYEYVSTNKSATRNNIELQRTEFQNVSQYIVLLLLGYGRENSRNDTIHPLTLLLSIKVSLNAVIYFVYVC